MGKVKPQRMIDAQVVEVGGRRIVLMDEDEYDRLLDALDAAEVKRIAADPRDRTLSWNEIKGEFIRNRIAAVREQAGVSQQELARRLKVRQSTVSRMERQDANLTLATIRKIARALRCSVHQLIA